MSDLPLVPKEVQVTIRRLLKTTVCARSGMHLNATPFFGAFDGELIFTWLHCGRIAGLPGRYELVDTSR